MARTRIVVGAAGSTEAGCAGAGGAGAHGHEFLDEAAAFGESGGDAQFLIFHHDLEGGYEVAFGDGFAAAGGMGVVTSGYGDGDEPAIEIGVAIFAAQ